MITRFLCCALALFLSPVAQACEGPAAFAGVREARCEELRDLELVRTDGSTASLGELVPGFARGEFVVLAFTEVGCPIASKLTPKLERLAHELGAQFLGIDASAQDSLAEIEQDSRELGRSFPVVKDARQALARALGARTTTEVFLFDGAGALAYRGAVDDQYALGAARPAPTQNYLVNALSALRAGKTPAPAATEAPGCALTLLPESELAEPLSYARDVAPILQRRCQACHRPGQVGPFSLLGYDDAKGRAKMIAQVVEGGVMPPWNADARYDGVFANERKLTGPEKETLLRWIAAGTPRGNPADEPKPLTWPEGWRIGTPDLVLTPETVVETREPFPAEGYAVPREGVIDYQYFTAETHFAEDRWIQAMEVHPGARDVVHHVLIAISVPGRGVDESSYLSVYVPGDTPSVYPQGYAKRLPAGAKLVFQLHYTPNGKERRDRSELGIVFAKEPPAFEVITDAIVNDDFEIPAGDANHEVRATSTLAKETGLVGLFPHMHMRGKDFRYVAHFPDGSEQELLFSHYDFQWQESYVLPDPMLLPAGTKLECIGHFDNSKANPNNPDPSKVVSWGDQSFEEMFIGYYDKVEPLE
ncbi:MAG: redoxin domain-containing protein [Planctomycetes bacterium]|nr:redoxin domain-containing protein [Planctomycetota bacterium]